MTRAHSRRPSWAASGARSSNVPVPAANHRRGDSLGGQCRCELSPHILILSPGNTSQKVELIIKM